MNKRRVALAFLIAPLITPLTVLIGGSVYFGVPPLKNVLTIFLHYGVFAYLVTAVFVAPVFFLLRTSRWRGKLGALLCGAAIWLVCGNVLLAFVPGARTGDFVKAGIFYAVVGALSGLVFWIISFGTKSGLPESTEFR